MSFSSPKHSFRISSLNKISIRRHKRTTDRLFVSSNNRLPFLVQNEDYDVIEIVLAALVVRWNASIAVLRGDHDDADVIVAALDVGGVDYFVDELADFLTMSRLLLVLVMAGAAREVVAVVKRGRN